MAKLMPRPRRWPSRSRNRRPDRATLGGTVVRQGKVVCPPFTNVPVGVYSGTIVRGGLWLRTPRLRAPIPLRG
jgi:hypothetical protein